MFPMPYACDGLLGLLSALFLMSLTFGSFLAGTFLFRAFLVRAFLVRAFLVRTFHGAPKNHPFCVPRRDFKQAFLLFSRLRLRLRQDLRRLRLQELLLQGLQEVNRPTDPGTNGPRIRNFVLPLNFCFSKLILFTLQQDENISDLEKNSCFFLTNVHGNDLDNDMWIALSHQSLIPTKLTLLHK